MTDYSKLTNEDLLAAIKAAEAAIRCPRVRGAFIDRQFAKGDWSWTQQRVISESGRQLDLLRAEVVARSSRAA